MKEIRFDNQPLRRGKNDLLLEAKCITMAALKFTRAPPKTRLLGAFWGALNLFPNAPTREDAIELAHLVKGRFVFHPTAYDASIGYEIEGSAWMHLTLLLEAAEAGKVDVVVEVDGAKHPRDYALDKRAGRR